MSLFKLTNISLANQLIRAADECTNIKEEEGGIILERDGDYKFIRIKNKYEGTSKAYGLYETDKEQLQELLKKHVMEEGWKLYASFHTHPTFSPSPSSLDVSALFGSFKYNYIYATEKRIFSYSQWVDEERLSVLYVPRQSLQNLVK